MKPASVLILSLPLLLSANFSRAQFTTPLNPSSGVATMQSTQIAPDGKITNFAVAVPNACPVGLRAQHTSDGSILNARDPHPKSSIGQALHLTVPASSHGAITEATILLRGFTPKGRTAQTASGANANAIRSRHVKFVPGPDQSATADIWVGGLSAITSIEINSATYADGFSWAPSGGLACSVQPDLLMRVHP
jgi:hypothetical protein